MIMIKVIIITNRSAGKTASGFKFPVLGVAAREQRTQLDLIKIMMVSKMIIERIKMMNKKMIIEPAHEARPSR